MMMVIVRSNYLAMRAYLQYQADVLQRDAQTVERKEKYLKHVVRWADDRPLEGAPDIRPVFPRYLAMQGMTAHALRRTCMEARAFFAWLRQEDPSRFRRLTDRWIETIRPVGVHEEPKAEHEAVTIEQVRQIVALPAADGDIAMIRDQAAAAFLFLSGCRASAFVTLTLDCIDLNRRTVMQYPSRGVRTKGRKAAVTRLLEVPDLLAVVERWDRIVRAALPATARWYAVVDVVNGEQRLVADEPGAARRVTLRKRIMRLFELAGLPPLSPHKFRHGHAVYALKLARNIADLKAISMNLMHSSIGITDGIYGVLSREDVAERIAALGTGSPIEGIGNAAELEEAVAAISKLLRTLKGA